MKIGVYYKTCTFAPPSIGAPTSASVRRMVWGLGARPIAEYWPSPSVTAANPLVWAVVMGLLAASVAYGRYAITPAARV